MTTETEHHMNPALRYTWASLFATGIVALYFQRKMMDGFNVVEFSPGGLMEIFVGVVILTIIIHSIVAAVFSFGPFEKIEKDERDKAIENKAEQYSYWFVYAAINVIIFSMLFENQFPNSEDHLVLFSVSGPSKMFFALLGTLFIGDIIKRISMIIMYRD